MKKVIFLFTLSLLFIYGCSKENSGATDLDQDSLNYESISIDLTGQSSGKASISMEEFLSKTGSVSARSDDSPQVNGHFSTQEGNTLSFTLDSDEGLGEFQIRGNINFKGDIICAVTEGNRAVLQVVVTKVGDLPEGLPDILGWTFLYLFEDNGEGNNAPSDRYYSQALSAPFTIDVCDGISPSFYLFILDIIGAPGEWKDTAKTSDQIQVN